MQQQKDNKSLDYTDVDTKRISDAHCRVCAKGLYQARAGGDACDSCAAGHFSDAQQQSSCKKCEAGSWSGTGASACEVCGEGPCR